MDRVCSKNRKRGGVVVVIEIEKEKKYAYLEPEGKFFCLRDWTFMS